MSAWHAPLKDLRWIGPTIGFVLLLGGMGITIKLALRDVRWPTLLFWTTAAYVATSILVALFGNQVLGGPARGTLLSLATGFAASLSFVLLNIALSHGEATQVVPFSSAYPIVTAALAVVVLHESVSWVRAGGILCVVIGLVLLTRSGG
jgi:transporter family protein